jgi:hypothetical protein
MADTWLDGKWMDVWLDRRTIQRTDGWMDLRVDRRTGG